MNRRIYDAVFEYRKKNTISFHMPGHKGKNFYFDGLSIGDIYKFDTTEIPGMDNLYQAEGIIKKSQDEAAIIYGAKESFFLTNGSTVGILTAILACVSENDKILAARNCHRSVISGMILSGAEPVYIYPEIMDCKIASSINPEKIEEAINKNNGIRAVVIVSPTYEGIVSDINKISEITKRAGAYLIVDCAHGAHFPFSDKFPDYPISADIVISSLHKTLPVFGQCAIINVYNEDLTQKTSAALAMVQTSSPSYLFLSTIDKFLTDSLNGLFPFKDYLQNLLQARNELNLLKNIKLLDREFVKGFSVYDLDITRLTFLTKYNNPGKFAQLLHEKYSIDLEASFLNHAIAISTIADTADDLNALVKAVREIDESFEYSENVVNLNMETLKPEIVYTPRKAWNMPGEYAELTKCTGRVSAESILVYPPGIAIVCPGEAFNNEVISYLIYCTEKSLSVQGLYGSRVRVLKEECMC